MNTSKKWMVSLADEDYVWVKKTSDEADISGSDLIKQTIDRCRDDKEFLRSLVKRKKEIQLRELTEKKQTLEEQIKELQEA